MSYLRPKDAETDYLAIIQANPAPDSTNEKVQLVLSNNEKLTIDGTETQLEYKKEGKVNVNSKQVDLSPKGNPAQAQEFNQLIVPVGRRSSITFADGTRLWVNSGSKVVYPVKFAKEKREIFAEGEIYLHVSRDEQKPFIVKTHQMDIKVLGTQFNVTAYENEANMQVVLVSGKVEVNLDKCKNVLAPNQMFSYDSKIHKGKITTVDTDDYVAWKDGYYQFHQQPLKEIVKKLSRYYGVRIYCKEPADKLSCSGKLDLKESLDEMMKALKEAAPIQIENKYESIEIKVKESCKINIAVLDEIGKQIHEGMTTAEIDDIVSTMTRDMGGIPAPLNYEGYPYSVCTSVNDQVCHGFPSKNVVLKSGDIINVDCSTILNGYFSDSSRMYCIGDVSDENRKLVQVTKECVELGLAQVKPWGFLGDVGQAVNDHARANGYRVVREIGGHGCGLEFHEDPWVSYVTKRGTEMALAPGMIFTIEPMVNMGTDEVGTHPGNTWEIFTADGKPSAQWEIMVLVTDTGHEVLSW